MNYRRTNVVKWVVYGTGFCAVLATSPLFEYFGTMAFAQHTVEVTEDSTHIPFSATVSVDAAESEPFNVCAWDLVLDLEPSLPLETELIVWGLWEPWNQSAFDEAYTMALEQAAGDQQMEDDDTAVEDTGAEAESEDTANIEPSSETGLFNDTSSDTSSDTSTTEEDDNTGSVEPFAQLNPEHRIFYETMQRFSESKYAYRIVNDGDVKGPLFEEYASIVVQDSRRFLYYSECGNTTDYFVLTVQGEPVSLNPKITMIAHQGERVAQPIACGGKVDNPDHLSVELSVVIE